MPLCGWACVKPFHCESVWDKSLIWLPHWNKTLIKFPITFANSWNDIDYFALNVNHLREWQRIYYLHVWPHWFWISSIKWLGDSNSWLFHLELNSCLKKYFVACWDFKSDQITRLLASKWKILHENIPQFVWNIHFPATATTSTTTRTAIAKNNISFPFRMLKTYPSKPPTINRFVIFYSRPKIHSF